MNHGKAYLAAQKICWPACWDCTEALRIARSRYTYHIARGTTDKLVPLAPTQKALRTLVNRHGFSFSGISRHIGITPTQLARVAQIGRKPFKEQKYVRSSLETKVMTLLKEQSGVKYARRRSDDVDPTLSRLALEGLMLQGWTMRQVAESTGVGYDTLTEILQRQRRSVIRQNHDLIVDFARRTGNAQGPSSRNRKMALRRGYRATACHDELL